jgi:hypothetical protein
MILSSTKFGGNQTKDVEVGPDRRTDAQTDRQTDRPIPIYPPPPNYVCGGYNYLKLKGNSNKICNNDRK